MRESLTTLPGLPQKHYGRKALVLIGRYGVPLAKVSGREHYNRMLTPIRIMFLQLLKVNSSLSFTVLAGCLRTTKERIFTGLDNVSSYPITDAMSNQYFGFNDAETNGLLKEYGLLGHFATTKGWYGGYRFGSIKVCSPWDVLRCFKELCVGKEAEPKDCRGNTSSNGAVRYSLGQAKGSMVKHERRQIKLLSGQMVRDIRHAGKMECFLKQRSRKRI